MRLFAYPRETRPQELKKKKRKIRDGAVTSAGLLAKGKSWIPLKSRSRANEAGVCPGTLEGDVFDYRSDSAVKQSEGLNRNQNQRALDEPGNSWQCF